MENNSYSQGGEPEGGERLCLDGRVGQMRFWHQKLGIQLVESNSSWPQQDMESRGWDGCYCPYSSHSPVLRTGPTTLALGQGIPQD